MMQGPKFWIKIGLFLSIPLILVGISYITQRGLPQQLLSSLTLTIASLSKRTSNVQGTTPSNSKPVVDNDLIVTCNIDANCGGGTREIKQSACNSLVCCGLPNGSWVEISYDECNKIENSYKSIYSSTQNNTAPNDNRVPVYLTSQKYAIDCPSQNIDAVKSIDTIMSGKEQELAKEYDECIATFESNDSCYASCTSTLRSNENRCLQNIEEWSNDEYEECKEGTSLVYEKCVEPCPLPYTACDWVYTGQKILLSQISKLCE